MKIITIGNMMRRNHFVCITILLSWVIPIVAIGQDASKNAIEFNRDIRPLLSDRCFLCHGPDQTSEHSTESSLRLDDRQSADDHGVFDFDDIASSEILIRILSDDESMQMPPPDSGKKRFTESEVAIIRQWIKEGAHYERHWAYVPPKRPTVPKISQPHWQSNPVDAFVLEKLKAENMSPSEPADRRTLIRRLSFDLTGLPPSVEEIDDFVSNPAPLDKAVEKVIDRLLSSHHYGEHMARHWLDAARYADTSGYQYDRERTHWVWRDWVIHSFNTNKPFDDFTIEQIAGDLLPNATPQTRLATGFNRNHPITIEGGVIDEEYRTEYVIDRVVTTSTVWLGQTFICSRCHDHKYDPISQRDFYSFFAYFNNVPERGLNGFDPKEKIPSPLANQELEKLKSRVASSRSKFDALKLPYDRWLESVQKDAPKWSRWAPDSIVSSGGATPKRLDDDSILLTGKNPPQDDYEILFTNQNDIRAIRLNAIRDPSLTNGSASRGSNGNFVLTEFTVEAADKNDPDNFQQVAIESATADYSQNGYSIEQAIDGKLNRKGWAVDGNTKPENRTATFVLSATIPKDSRIRIKLIHRFGLSHQIGRFRLAFSESKPLSTELDKIVQDGSIPTAESLDDKWKLYLIERFGDDNAKQVSSEWTEAVKARDAAANYPATMIMRELSKPRATYVLNRGEYDKPIKTEKLPPGIPADLGTLPTDSIPNRLGLAQWLVARNQPLTARVTVNRYWQQLFGTGLVQTSEDFGSQGEYPSHPELLDWLAVEFMESGWDIKGILKTIVMSKTYQQSSRLTPEMLKRDPNNRLLGRGPRVRLDGEMIRDAALAAAGLLDRKIGGPSVYPYHPKGLWLEINNRPNFSRPYPHPEEKAQQYRRSMYTFWKRTVPPPSVATFDAPSREYCVVRRSRTNTPLQAFVMLHDPQFVEAANFLAQRMISEGGETADSQIEYGFQLCTSRTPNRREKEVLKKIYNRQFVRYQADSEAAKRLLSIGVGKLDLDTDIPKLAATAQVARTMLNLSEFLTKE